MLQETLQHDIFGGINYCNVRIGAVLPWKEGTFRLQLQFFSPCYVGINYCNVTPFLYRILSFQNIICNNFVSNGMPMASPMCLKITGRGRSSHLEGYSHEKNPENRWVSCQLPRVLTPGETINCTNQRPDRKFMCRWHG